MAQIRTPPIKATRQFPKKRTPRKHSNFDVYDKELNALYKSVTTGRRPGTMRTNKPPDAIMSDPLPSIPIPRVNS